MRILLACMLLFTTFAAPSTAADSPIPAHKRSEQTKGEWTRVTLDETGPAQGGPEFAGGLILSIATAVLPKAIEFGVDQIEKAIKREEERYTKQWSGLASGNAYYKSRLPGAPISLKQITVERFVTYEKQEDTPAFKLELGVEPSMDQAFIRVVPQSLKVDFSKAKTRGHDDTIDLRVDVRFHTYQITTKGEVKVATIETAPMMIKSVKLGKKYEGTDLATFGKDVSSGWLPRIPRNELAGFEFTGAGDRVVIKHLGLQRSESVPTESNGGADGKKLTFGDQDIVLKGIRDDTIKVEIMGQGYELSRDKGVLKLPQYGRGVYAVEVIVTESDDFGKVVGKVGAYVSENKEDIATKLGEVLLNALGVEEEESEQGGEQ